MQTNIASMSQNLSDGKMILNCPMAVGHLAEHQLSGWHVLDFLPFNPGVDWSAKWAVLSANKFLSHRSEVCLHRIFIVNYSPMMWHFHEGANACFPLLLLFYQLSEPD